MWKNFLKIMMPYGRTVRFMATKADFFPKMILNQKSLVLVKMIAFISALREKFVQFFA